MRAITFRPGAPNSARLEDIEEPEAVSGTILAKTLAIGICGTDRELIAGHYGWAPPGRTNLVLGHESLGTVIDAPADSGFVTGDTIVGIVRRPDPAPCRNCAVGEWDMCRNGNYTERGIKELDGYCSERFRVQPEFAVHVDPALESCGVLLEPASIVAKAWEHIEHIGRRARWTPQRALITGPGPIGLIAALLAKQRGLEVHVLGLTEGDRKSQLARDLGARYHTGTLGALGIEPDVVVECTGDPTLVSEVMRRSAHAGIVCLTGLSSGRHEIPFDFAGLGRALVLENDVVFGSVNANRRHYEAAATALAAADRTWLEGLITRRLPLKDWARAFCQREPDDIKTIIDFGL